MSNIDNLLKSVSASSKRKTEAIRDPTEIYKAARTGNPSPRAAHIEEDEDEDMEAGPARPPADEEAGPKLPDDDNEGRFFGGGITKNEEEILDYVQGDDVPEETIDEPWLRRKILALEKHINKNAELRAKFEDEPQKFITSEADLDADIKGLSILSEYPHLFPVLSKLNSVESLMGLLAHENTDIAIDVLQLFGELIDDETGVEEADWDALVNPMLEADFLSLLHSNLTRFDENDNADSSGVYHGLWILESICSSRKSISETVAAHKGIVSYLIERASRAESSVSQNKQYATEVLAILAQTSKNTCGLLTAADIVDCSLQLVAPYRRKDPAKSGAEKEYMENLFEILVCMADHPAGKQAFLDAEGVELCILLITDSKKVKTPALRLLDHASDSSSDAATARTVCVRIVEAAGLKPIFATFYKTKDRATLEHTLGLLASMAQLLPMDEAPRIRLQAKWVEKEYQKINKLLTLRKKFTMALADVDKKYGATKDKLSEGTDEKDEDVFLSKQLDAGLFTLRNVDLILAWEVVTDKGVRAYVSKNTELSSIADTLDGLREGMDVQTENDKDTEEMIKILVSLLKE